MGITKKQLNQYTGDYSQLFSVKQYRFEGGRSDGMRGVDIDNGAGLTLTMLPDRAMDINKLSYKGVNYSYITKAGLVKPEYYDDKEAGWLKTFGAGFLTTCGLTQVGNFCLDGNEEVGLHGHISTTPAENFSAYVDYGKETPEISIKGYMRSGKLFGCNLWMNREIRILAGDNKIYIFDEVENRGGEKQPYMVLYHFNIGYPLLDEHAEFITSADFVAPRDEIASAGEKERKQFQRPQQGFAEQVFYYKQKNVENQWGFAGLYNDKLGRGVKIWTDANQLKNLIQWKNAGYGDYVMGIEPANCFVEGRVQQKEYGLEYIHPGEVKKQSIVIELV